MGAKPLLSTTQATQSVVLAASHFGDPSNQAQHELGRKALRYEVKVLLVNSRSVQNVRRTLQLARFKFSRSRAVQAALETSVGDLNHDDIYHMQKISFDDKNG